MLWVFLNANLHCYTAIYLFIEKIEAIYFGK